MEHTLDTDRKTIDGIEGEYTDFIIKLNRKEWFAIQAELQSKGMSYKINEDKLESQDFLELVVEVAEGIIHYRYTPKPTKYKILIRKPLNEQT